MVDLTKFSTNFSFRKLYAVFEKPGLIAFFVLNTLYFLCILDIVDITRQPCNKKMYVAQYVEVYRVGHIILWFTRDPACTCIMRRHISA